MYVCMYVCTYVCISLQAPEQRADWATFHWIRVARVALQLTSQGRPKPSASLPDGGPAGGAGQARV